MNLRRHPIKTPSEPMLPMINVAVLLLVLLAAGARLEPPDPLPVSLPDAPGEASEGGAARLFLGVDGALAYGDLRGSEALGAAAEAAGLGVLRLHADQDVTGETLVTTLQNLGASGLESVELMVVRP
ncbi:biopolymer transporter ExbD [Pararhodobacter oceanensis]|uniref:biopolymer transporter ExbD n=1 Tax=Pararhodobacter oceanensis TaxID=2172121 RepID=UPI003A90686A